MGYWWVNHKQTYKKEIGGGYIWAPTKEKNGAKNQTYINLTKARVNDVIFSYAYGQIKAIGVVQNQSQESERPSAFGKAGNQWSSHGWLVKVTWSVLEKPITPKSHLSRIASFLPQKHSPIQASGAGNQKCYLAEISGDLARILLELAKIEDAEITDKLEELRDSVVADEEESRIREASMDETEKEQLVKARRGQGLFRIRLEKIDRACRLTGVRDKRLLIASHIKPWRKSSNVEKLDGNNGLLLSPHVDKLFDRGWISFSDDGTVLCANIEIRRTMTLWGLNPDQNVGRFNKKQKEYLAFHRGNIYKA